MGTIGVEHRADDAGRGALIAYFSEQSAAALPLDALHEIPGVQSEATSVPDIDWVARFREGFRAFDAGSFRIVPVWDDPEPFARTLIVDPGRAFGTGTHETTRLCLKALETLATSPGLGRVADIGTGSGLLAIAALRLGASGAVGVDNDVEALQSAASHARLNRAELRLVAGDGGRPLKPLHFDTVLANLMAPLLIERRDELARLRSRNGRLVLSGLLEEDLEMVRAAYAGLGPTQEMRDGEWAALVIG
jgi:ribosomal protein L11 methyltransferase